jgi:Zn-dependent peptidase ImmA (M78 family)
LNRTIQDNIDINVRLCYINGCHEPVRKRSSYAHEYGHALFDRQEELRLAQDRNSTELVEKRANAFAAGFLMPAGGVLDQLRLRRHRTRLARAPFVMAEND